MRGVPIPRYDALKLGLPAKQALVMLMHSEGLIVPSQAKGAQ